MDSNNEIGLNYLKEEYDISLMELSEFINSGKTYKELTVTEFKVEVRLFWERSDLWRQVLENGVYTKEKLNGDFRLFREHAKRLLL